MTQILRSLFIAGLALVIPTSLATGQAPETPVQASSETSLVLGNPSGTEADAANPPDAAQPGTPDETPSDTAQTITPPKRLSGMQTGSQGSKKTAKPQPPTPPSNGQKSKATTPATAAKGNPIASSDVARSKSSLRPVEPKKLTEAPGAEGEPTVSLRYRFTPGTVIRSEVTHLAKNGTRIDSVQQDATSRTVTDKSWTVIEVADGKTTFDYRIDAIDMSQQVNNGNEIRYSSREATDELPPVQFAHAADKVGTIVSTIQIDDQGMVIARSDIHNPPHMGMGDVTVPLPKSPVAVGATWEIAREMRIERKDKNFRLVKFREFFKLEKVSAGIATISVRSEPLSTIADPAEEAQVLQQLSNGTIQFDIDAGRMISKELAWDHQVVAFSGPGSVFEYSARLDDHVVATETATRAAAKQSATKK